MAQQVFYIVLLGVSLFFFVMTLVNVEYLHRATSAARVKSGPFVSVIVPARNEEAAIERCIGSLLDQDYEGYEVIVVDDESTDATAKIVSEMAERDPRLRLVKGTALPEGWLGKPHALYQGAAAARGEILVLTDADSVHERTSISWGVTNLQDHDADLVSGYVGQEYGSLGESVVVPVTYLALLLLPMGLLPRTKSSRFSFAIGQYIVLRCSALTDVGGFEANRDAIIDDMSMAIRMKDFGHREVFLDASKAARCHLYTGFRDAFNGIKRSIYSALGASPVNVVLVSAIVLAFIVYPVGAVLWSALRFQAPAVPLLAAVALFAALWGVIVWDRRVPIVAWLLYPFVFLNLVVILNASMIGTGFGRGVEWKGRLIRTPGKGDSPEPQVEERR